MSARPRFYVTTPIYYVNDDPHIGHTYTTVVADVVARYRRATGHDVRFLTGTDEHGQKIERAARAQGLEPIRLADRVVERYHELWRDLEIGHDDFIRTTDPRHRLGVHRLVEKIRARGDLYLGSYEGWYCAGCESFYPESQLVDERCPEQGHPVERLAEESYFFRLSRYQEPLLEHFRNNPQFVRPESRFNEVKAFVASGLKDLSVSRSSITWGIPFPGAPELRVYVWLDALTNYMSALGYGSDDDRLWRTYWPAQVHLVGKDILRFHAVYWPAFLLSAGEPLPECVFAHGWWLRDEAKMSKSLGNVVKPGPLIRDFGADGLRYFLMREMTFGQDGTYSDEQLLDRYNSDLANDLGNLTSRIVTLIHSGCDGFVPEDSKAEEARALAPAAETAFAEYRRAFDAYEFSQGLAAVWGLVGATNRFLVEHAPWELAKHPDRRERHRAVLRGAAEALVQAACMAAPVMPRACREIAARLGTRLPEELREFRWGLLPAGGRVVKGDPLFPRIDKKRYFDVEGKPMNEDARDTGVGKEPASKPAAPAAGSTDERISIDAFMNVELRVARVLAAERVAGTDKLLRLEIDVGDLGKRQIVAGIAQQYEAASLVGKTIVVVANLKPARVRGVESQGMLLAADAGDGPVVATFETDVRPGTRVR